MGLDADLLQKPFRKLRKVLKHFPDRPSSEDVHQLRTQIRRQEAVIQAMGLDQEHDGTHLLALLKPIRKASGEVRDMDVLTGFASTLEKDSDDQCRIQLLEYLGSRRAKEVERLHKTIDNQGKEARQYLKRCLKSIQQRLSSSRNDLAQSAQISTRSMALSLQLETRLGAWPKLNAKTIHSYRLEVKQLRYTLQLAGGRDPEFIEASGEVKDSIGEWHDWTELGVIADKVFSHGALCNTTRQIRRSAAKKFEKALAVTNAMRAQYLRPATDGRRKRLPVRLKDSVVRATSRLAG